MQKSVQIKYYIANIRKHIPIIKAILDTNTKKIEYEITGNEELAKKMCDKLKKEYGKRINWVTGGVINGNYFTINKELTEKYTLQYFEVFFTDYIKSVDSNMHAFFKGVL